MELLSSAWLWIFFLSVLIAVMPERAFRGSWDTGQQTQELTSLPRDGVGVVETPTTSDLLAFLVNTEFSLDVPSRAAPQGKRHLLN